MKRDLGNILESWVKSNNRKPLILRGARQVGKSWLVRELGKAFKYFVEVNFDKRSEFEEFFKMTKDPQELVELLSNYTGVKIIPGETLLFLDEIQNCPEAISSLRYFFEEMPELHVVAAGSLLEFELRKISLPVGRIQFLYVYPLSFGEFLCAVGREDLREMLINNQLNPIPLPIDRMLKEFVRIYTITGGMPEVVKTYIESKDLHECQNNQADILQTYRRDFHKYAKKHQIKYLEKLFTTLPLQTGRKFKYSEVDPAIKSITLSDSLDLLCSAGIVRKIYHSSSNGIPISAETDLKKFKIVFFDIGLMLNLINFDFKPLLLDPDIAFINNGVLAEQFVAQNLVAYSNPRREAQLFYWHRESRSSNAEVDYVIEFNNKVVPIEVKSGTKGAMKSMKIFMESKNCDFGLKISSYPYSLNDSVQSIPFYGMEAFLKSQK
ncbi:MAG TPA: ATP-binding protein [bacterium]|nr:ATP-binding protein [bacterium]